MFSLDRCYESCNILDSFSSRICVPNKTEDVNLNFFNIITRINGLTTLLRNITCDCKCEFDGRKSSSSQKWNKDLCRCEWKKSSKMYTQCIQKDYVRNLSTSACKINRVLLVI